MKAFYTVLNLLCLAAFLKTVAGSCKGCVELDSLTFDKVLANFKYSIVKFDVPYPYGPKHEEFETFAKEVADQPELVVGALGIKDYGDKDNQDLADRYNVKVNELPVILLFRQNDLKNPVRFADEEFTAVSYSRFVRQHTELYLGLPGCIKPLDELASKFVLESGDAQKQTLQSAEKLSSSYEGKKEAEMAKVYVAYMNRITERGLSFVEAERQRLKKILGGKISEAKKDDLKRRLNILESFKVEGGPGKVEL